MPHSRARLGWFPTRFALRLLSRILSDGAALRDTTALGAHVWGILSTIARRAVIQLSVGPALGAVWAWILLRGIANDAIVIPINLPVTISLTTVVAALVGVIACASPMLRGLRIQPTEALREF